MAKAVKSAHTMRVIAGSHRRRQLKAVPHGATRSTKDRVKESLFNMLAPLESFQHCLDLFAGSGALGIEAMSRGTPQVTFIEHNPIAHTVLQANMASLGLNERATLKQTDALVFIQQTKQRYDLIILDPPYQTTLVDQALSIIVERSLLVFGGVIVILSEKDRPFLDQETLVCFKRRNIGMTAVTLLKGAIE